jgi:hypothetical protein
LVQDRDGGARVLDRARMAMPSLALVFADGGYAGRLVRWARRVLRTEPPRRVRRLHLLESWGHGKIIEELSA